MPATARAQVYVSQVFNGGVGKYNATTGAVVNANFITGLSDPCALAIAPSLRHGRSLP